MKKWSREMIEYLRRPMTPWSPPGDPPENHQKHFFWRWILHTSNEIARFLIWGCFGESTFKIQKNYHFSSRFRSSPYWIYYKNQLFFNTFENTVFLMMEKKTIKKRSLWAPLVLWKPYNSCRFLMIFIFKKLSFFDRFLGPPKWTEAEKVIISLDVWQNVKKQKL